MKEIPLGNGQNAKVDDEDFGIYYLWFVIDYFSEFSVCSVAISIDYFPFDYAQGMLFGE